MRIIAVSRGAVRLAGSIVVCMGISDFAEIVKAQDVPWGATANWSGGGYAGRWELKPKSATKGVTYWTGDTRCRRIPVSLNYAGSSVTASGVCRGIRLTVTIRKGSGTAAFEKNPWNTKLTSIKIR